VYINSVAFSPDSPYAIISTNTATTGRDLYLAELQGDRKLVPLLQSEFNEWMPVISPDGRWLAYVSDESGQPQVYVRPFPQGGARVQVSAGGGSQPRWTGDSRSLVYLGGDRLVKATFNSTAGMTLVRQDTLFDAKLITANVNTQFDIAANGSFVAARPASEDPELIVVSDWAAELRRRSDAASRKP
jgi:serine/threonine-protein kinase